MQPFTYNALPYRVVFGSGTLAAIPTEIERLGLRRVLVLSTPPQESDARSLAALIGSRCAGVFAGAVMHTPLDVTENAMKLVTELQIDGLVAIGGGSTIGLCKAIALRTDLTQIVVPTTYAGSEMTPILGETQDGKKVTQRSSKILPDVVIYDVDLTLSLPPGLSGTSGINAIAHAVEALYAENSNPITSMMALEAITAMHRSLPTVVADPSDQAARSHALYAAWLCGACLGVVGMSLHHKLCHTIGGLFDLPHAETHTAILPHALRYNAPAIPKVIDQLKAVFNGNDPADALFDLGRAVGAPASLKELGMPESGIDVATDQTLSNAYWNPRPLDRSGIRNLLEAAFNGRRPSFDVSHANVEVLR